MSPYRPVPPQARALATELADGKAFEADVARAAGYHQMRDHSIAELINRLDFSDRATAAALRGAAEALEERAKGFDECARIFDPPPVGYVTEDAGTGNSTYWCLGCAPESVRVEANEIYAGSQAAEEGDCDGCGRWLGDEDRAVIRQHVQDGTEMAKRIKRACEQLGTADFVVIETVVHAAVDASQDAAQIAKDNLTELADELEELVGRLERQEQP